MSVFNQNLTDLKLSLFKSKTCMNIRNMIGFLLVTSIISLLSACAFIPEQVHLQPQVSPVMPENVGGGKLIAVEVVDARGDTTLGGRPSAYGPIAGITLADNIQTVVQNSIDQGLRAYGFKPVSSNSGATRKLTLHIIALQYKQRLGLLNSTLAVNSAMEVTANNGNKVYDRVYHGKQDSYAFVTPTSSQDTQNINAVFSNTLNQVLQDRQLMNFLEN